MKFLGKLKRKEDADIYLWNITPDERIRTVSGVVLGGVVYQISIRKICNLTELKSVEGKPYE